MAHSQGLSEAQPAAETSVDELTRLRTVKVGRVITAEEVRRFLDEDG